MKIKVMQLSENDIIGKGLARTCYQHPGDRDICIKIDHFEARNHRDTPREASYYRRIAFFKPHFDYEIIPKFYGQINTNLGPGAMFELVRDDSGAISRTLDQIPKEFLCQNLQRLRNAVDDLVGKLFRDGILVRDLHPGNIAVKINGENSFKLIIIDGIGHTDFIPLVDCSKWFARKKLARYFKKPKFQTVTQLLDELEAEVEHVGE